MSCRHRAFQSANRPAMALTCCHLLVVLLGCNVVWGPHATLLRTAPKPASQSVVPADRDLLKLQGIAHSLQSLLTAHAPNGTKDLLLTIQRGEIDLKAAGRTEKARTVVMKTMYKALNDYKAKLNARERSLKKENASDYAERVKDMSRIAVRLQSRLDHLNQLEQKARKALQEQEASDAKAKASTSTDKQTREAKKIGAMLKHLAKKHKRQLKRKLAKWDAERK